MLFSSILEGSQESSNSEKQKGTSVAESRVQMGTLDRWNTDLVAIGAIIVRFDQATIPEWTELGKPLCPGYFRKTPH